MARNHVHRSFIDRIPSVLTLGRAMVKPQDQQHGGARIAAYWAVILVMLVVLLEALAFAADFLADDLFDHRDSAFARLAERQMTGKQNVDPVLGWEPIPSSEFIEADCVGQEILYQVAADGARNYPGYEPADATVVVAGDSYAFGSEAPDPAAFPAVLAELLAQPVANLGVGGYGPVQALLRLERHIDEYPNAHTVVLGIMYENVHRMVNSYRPVLYDKTDVLAFTPYMRDGGLQPYPGTDALSSEESLRRQMTKAFDTDFWAKPQHRFPYSLALFKAISSHYFMLRKVQKSLRKTGRPEYAMTFASPAIQENLFGLLDRFSKLAERRGLRGIVLFMPRNRLDVASVQALLNAERSRLPATLLALDVAEADVDWSRYNLENKADDNICHPSEYGYIEIARYLAAKLR